VWVGYGLTFAYPWVTHTIPYDYTILNTYYNFLLMKIFLLLQSSYFCYLFERYVEFQYKSKFLLFKTNYILSLKIILYALQNYMYIELISLMTDDTFCKGHSIILQINGPFIQNNISTVH